MAIFLLQNQNLLKRKMKTPILKIIATFLVLCFVFQEISFANPDLAPFSWSRADAASKSWAKSLFPTLPESVAVVEDAWKAEDSSKLIYLIQDAHTNSSGQLNVAKTLDYLSRDSELNHIFLEAGSSDLSLSFLRKDSSLEKRKQVGLSYLKKGELQGSEYLDLTSQNKIVLWGVEDEGLYKKALETYRSIKKEETKYRDYLERVDKTIKLLKPKILNPFLLEFDQKREKYKKEELSITQYFDILLEECGRLDLSLKSYPNLRRLNKLKNFEQTIDFQKANDEQKKAVASLSPQAQKELFAASQESHGPLKLGNDEKRAEKAFFVLLEEKLMLQRKSGAETYPNLFQYFRYLRKAKDLNLKEILNEQKKLEADILKALTVSDEERDLLRSSDSVEFLKKLLNLTITPEDYEQYRQNKEYFDIKKITGFLNKKIMLLKQLYEDAIFLEDGYEKTIGNCEEFYELTYQRDQAFIRNMLDRMESEAARNNLGAGDAGGEASAARSPNASYGRGTAEFPQAAGPAPELGSSVAALITGGYHTPNLKYLLKKQNISYIVLTPQIFHETNQKRYEKLLLSQKIQSSMPALGVSASTHTMMLGQVMTDYLGNRDEFIRDVSDKEALYALAGSRLASQGRKTQMGYYPPPFGFAKRLERFSNITFLSKKDLKLEKKKAKPTLLVSRYTGFVGFLHGFEDRKLIVTVDYPERERHEEILALGIFLDTSGKGYFKNEADMKANQLLEFELKLEKTEDRRKGIVTLSHVGAYKLNGPDREKLFKNMYAWLRKRGFRRLEVEFLGTPESPEGKRSEWFFFPQGWDHFDIGHPRRGRMVYDLHRSHSVIKEEVRKQIVALKQSALASKDIYNISDIIVQISELLEGDVHFTGWHARAIREISQHIHDLNQSGARMAVVQEAVDNYHRSFRAILEDPSFEGDLYKNWSKNGIKVRKLQLKLYHLLTTEHEKIKEAIQRVLQVERGVSQKLRPTGYPMDHKLQSGFQGREGILEGALRALEDIQKFLREAGGRPPRYDMFVIGNPGDEVKTELLSMITKHDGNEQAYKKSLEFIDRATQNIYSELGYLDGTIDTSVTGLKRLDSEESQNLQGLSDFKPEAWRERIYRISKMIKSFREKNNEFILKFADLEKEIAKIKAQIAKLLADIPSESESGADGKKVKLAQDNEKLAEREQQALVLRKQIESTYEQHIAEALPMIAEGHEVIRDIERDYSVALVKMWMEVVDRKLIHLGKTLGARMATGTVEKSESSKVLNKQDGSIFTKNVFGARLAQLRELVDHFHAVWEDIAKIKVTHSMLKDKKGFEDYFEKFGWLSLGHLAPIEQEFKNVIESYENASDPLLGVSQMDDPSQAILKDFKDNLARLKDADGLYSRPLTGLRERVDKITGQLQFIKACLEYITEEKVKKLRAAIGYNEKYAHLESESWKETEPITPEDYEKLISFAGHAKSALVQIKSYIANSNSKMELAAALGEEWNEKIEEWNVAVDSSLQKLSVFEEFEDLSSLQVSEVPKIIETLDEVVGTIRETSLKFIIPYSGLSIQKVYGQLKELKNILSGARLAEVKKPVFLELLPMDISERVMQELLELPMIEPSVRETIRTWWESYKREAAELKGVTGERANDFDLKFVRYIRQVIPQLRGKYAIQEPGHVQVVRNMDAFSDAVNRLWADTEEFIDLNEVVKSVLTLISGNSKNHNIEFEEALLPLLFARPDEMAYLFLGLLLPLRGVKLKIEARVEYGKPGANGLMNEGHIVFKVQIKEGVSEALNNKYVNDQLSHRVARVFGGSVEVLGSREEEGFEIRLPVLTPVLVREYKALMTTDESWGPKAVQPSALEDPDYWLKLLSRERGDDGFIDPNNVSGLQLREARKKEDERQARHLAEAHRALNARTQRDMSRMSHLATSTPEAVSAIHESIHAKPAYTYFLFLQLFQPDPNLAPALGAIVKFETANRHARSAEEDINRYDKSGLQSALVRLREAKKLYELIRGSKVRFFEMELDRNLELVEQRIRQAEVSIRRFDELLDIYDEDGNKTGQTTYLEALKNGDRTASMIVYGYDPQGKVILVRRQPKTEEDEALFLYPFPDTWGPTVARHVKPGREPMQFLKDAVHAELGIELKEKEADGKGKESAKIKKIVSVPGQFYDQKAFYKMAEWTAKDPGEWAVLTHFWKDMEFQEQKRRVKRPRRVLFKEHKPFRRLFMYTIDERSERYFDKYLSDLCQSNPSLKEIVRTHRVIRAAFSLALSAAEILEAEDAAEKGQMATEGGQAKQFRFIDPMALRTELEENPGDFPLDAYDPVFLQSEKPYSEEFALPRAVSSPLPPAPSPELARSEDARKAFGQLLNRAHDYYKKLRKAHHEVARVLAEMEVAVLSTSVKSKIADLKGRLTEREVRTFTELDRLIQFFEGEFELNREVFLGRVAQFESELGDSMREVELVLQSGPPRLRSPLASLKAAMGNVRIFLDEVSRGFENSSFEEVFHAVRKEKENLLEDEFDWETLEILRLSNMSMVMEVKHLQTGDPYIVKVGLPSVAGENLNGAAVLKREATIINDIYQRTKGGPGGALVPPVQFGLINQKVAQKINEKYKASTQTNSKGVAADKKFERLVSEKVGLDKEVSGLGWLKEGLACTCAMKVTTSSAKEFVENLLRRTRDPREVISAMLNFAGDEIVSGIRLLNQLGIVHGDFDLSELRAGPKIFDYGGAHSKNAQPWEVDSLEYLRRLAAPSAKSFYRTFSEGLFFSAMTDPAMAGRRYEELPDLLGTYKALVDFFGMLPEEVEYSVIKELMQEYLYQIGEEAIDRYIFTKERVPDDFVAHELEKLAGLLQKLKEGHWFEMQERLLERLRREILDGDRLHRARLQRNLSPYGVLVSFGKEGMITGLAVEKEREDERYAIPVQSRGQDISISLNEGILTLETFPKRLDMKEDVTKTGVRDMVLDRYELKESGGQHVLFVTRENERDLEVSRILKTFDAWTRGIRLPGKEAPHDGVLEPLTRKGFGKEQAAVIYDEVLKTIQRVEPNLGARERDEQIKKIIQAIELYTMSGAIMAMPFRILSKRTVISISGKGDAASLRKEISSRVASLAVSGPLSEAFSQVRLFEEGLAEVDPRMASAAGVLLQNGSQRIYTSSGDPAFKSLVSYVRQNGKEKKLGHYVWELTGGNSAKAYEVLRSAASVSGARLAGTRHSTASPAVWAPKGARLAAKVVYENAFTADQFTGDDPEIEERKLDVQKPFEGAILSALAGHGVAAEKVNESPYSLGGLAKAFMSEVFQNSMQRARNNPEGMRQIRLSVVDTGSAIVTRIANRTTDAPEQIQENIRNFNDKLNQSAEIDDSLVEDISFGEDIINGYGFGIRIVSDMLKVLYPNETALLELGSEKDSDENDWMVVTMRLPLSSGARLADLKFKFNKNDSSVDLVRSLRDYLGQFDREKRFSLSKHRGVFMDRLNETRGFTEQFLKSENPSGQDKLILAERLVAASRRFKGISGRVEREAESLRERMVPQWQEPGDFRLAALQDFSSSVWNLHMASTAVALAIQMDERNNGARMAHSKKLGKLIRQLREGDHIEQRQAIWAIGEMGPRKDSYVRKLTINVLRHLGRGALQKAAPDLTRLFWKESEDYDDVRREASYALAAMGTKGWRILIRAMRSKNPRSIELAERALLGAHDEKVVAFLIQVIRNGKNNDFAIQVAKVISGIMGARLAEPDREYEKILKAAIQDGDVKRINELLRRSRLTIARSGARLAEVEQELTGEPLNVVKGLVAALHDEEKRSEVYDPTSDFKYKYQTTGAYKEVFLIKDYPDLIFKVFKTMTVTDKKHYSHTYEGEISNFSTIFHNAEPSGLAREKDMSGFKLKWVVAHKNKEDDPDIPLFAPSSYFVVDGEKITVEQRQSIRNVTNQHVQYLSSLLKQNGLGVRDWDDKAKNVGLWPEYNNTPVVIDKGGIELKKQEGTGSLVKGARLAADVETANKAIDFVIQGLSKALTKSNPNFDFGGLRTAILNYIRGIVGFDVLFQEFFENQNIPRDTLFIIFVYAKTLAVYKAFQPYQRKAIWDYLSSSRTPQDVEGAISAILEPDARKEDERFKASVRQIFLKIEDEFLSGGRLAATKPSKDVFQRRYHELSDFLRSVGDKYPSFAPFVSGEKQDFLNWLKGNLRDPNTNVKQLEPDSLQLAVWQKDAKSGEPSIEFYFNEIIKYPEFAKLVRVDPTVAVDRPELAQKLYDEVEINPDEVVSFIMSIHNAQHRGGSIAVSSQIFEAVFYEATNNLRIYGYGKKLFDGKPYKIAPASDFSRRTSVFLLDFKLILEKSYGAVHANFEGLPKALYAKKRVVEIDLDGLKTKEDPGSFSQVIAPLLVREMDLAHSKIHGKAAKFLLSGNRTLKKEVMKQMAAFYKEKRRAETPDFVVEDEKELGDYKDAPRVMLAVPREGLKKGGHKRYFFYKALEPGDFPNLRSLLEVLLTLRGIEELDVTDPSYRKVRQAAMLLLGLENINDKEFIKVLNGEERNVKVLMLYAAPPITRLALEALVRGARLAAKMAEQAA